jgi:cardiolipin synthase (CMP-forming)
VGATKTEGERWAEELLKALRYDRFTPGAWIRFFGASLARARENRSAHIRAHRQVLALGAAGIGTWVAVGAAGRPVLGTAALAWWLLVLLMAEWHLGMLERGDGRALPGLGVANTITLLRAGAIPLLPVLAPTALGVVVLAAGLSDVADGLVARARGEVSRLGAWLDGAVDGILLSLAAVAAADRALLPTWVAALVVGRYLLPWLVIAVVYFLSAQAPDRDVYVSGRAPGALLVVGLALAAFVVPGADFLAAVGALGGLATFGATIVLGASRFRRARARAETAEPPPAGPPAPRMGRRGSSA